MRVSVYDTYVPRDDKTIMHFDILVDENVSTEQVYEYGTKYLSQKGLTGRNLTTSECRFCHMETAPVTVEEAIITNGYYIIEIENCN